MTDRILFLKNLLRSLRRINTSKISWFDICKLSKREEVKEERVERKEEGKEGEKEDESLLLLHVLKLSRLGLDILRQSAILS